MTNRQVFCFTTLISLLAAPYIAVLSFLVF
jgi:hypothetical protein